MNDPTVIYIPGPQGPSGPSGLLGPVGPRGYQGTDGHGIYSGKGPPPNALGGLGDFWLDLTTYEIYGPRVSQTVWPNSGVALKGPMGERGDVGATILSGAEPPASELGRDGDVYIEHGGLLWGPKTQGAWPSDPVALAGPVGPQGPSGSIGEVGPAGPVGPIGPQGPAGADSTVPGPMGVAGPAGVDGTRWFQGDGPPAQANDYPDGSYYYDRVNAEIFPPAD